MSRDTWDGEGEAGGFVPLYVLVNGRTSPRNANLDLATQVIAVKSAAGLVEPEYETIVKHCSTWISIAELAAHLKYPLSHTRLLVDVLLERRVLAVGTQAEETVATHEMLETILASLENL